MVKALLSAGLILGLCASAQAAPSAASRQAATSSAQRYWLSDGLNRLVFWRSPAGALQAERKSAR